jgi:hypothetical protein
VLILHDLLPMDYAKYSDTGPHFIWLSVEGSRPAILQKNENVLDDGLLLLTGCEIRRLRWGLLSKCASSRHSNSLGRASVAVIISGL